MTAMKKTIKASLLASAIAMFPLGSQAAGLGAINVFSGLGQPLRAEIELSATPEEIKSLAAVVASPEAFRRANLQYSAALTSVRLAIERRGSRAVVKVTSDRPLNEPFVDLLLELNWASGSLLREYTFLLDPVSVAQPAPVAPRPAASSAPVVKPAAATPAAATPAAAAPRSASGTGSYSVQRGDTLRRVAESTRPADATLEQMLVALYRDNPDAFEGSNMNRLRAGSVLKVPDAAAVRAIDSAAARQEVRTQAADFNAYRSKLAGAVAARPLAEEPASRADSGAVVPKVTEPAAKASGDQVKVSGGREGGGAEDPRLARLQALEEELAARDKALEEANSRLAALEESLRQMQQLLELRSSGMAQLQQQAAAAAPAPAPAAQPAPAPTPAPAPAPTEVQAPPAAAPTAEAPKPAEAASPAPKPAPKPAPAPQPEPSFLQTLLDDPMMLAGGGGILALLLAYAGIKVRQRRQQASTPMAGGAASQFPIETNSVFGKTGGQSVNTGESSVVHTDFSQSGLSAIDTDEGVDPVAEADVYMAYGRDAQAEEILLDALKTDSSRLAIYLKLLEIYAQRGNLKSFEATATDLYSRTGGEGSDWDKAAEMGRRLDPDNPLYQGRAASGRAGAAAAGAAMAGAAAAEAAMTAAPPVERLEAKEPEISVELEALPQVEEGALDFDLDVGLGFGDEAARGETATAQAAEAVEDLAKGDAMEIDLDLDSAPSFKEEARTANTPPAVDMNETVIGEGLDFAAADQGMEFDLGFDKAEAAAPSAEFNLDATVVGAEESEQRSAEEVSSDLEKTTFDSSLLDFDFNLDDGGAQPPEDMPAPDKAPVAPALDLSGIDLELDSGPAESLAPQVPAAAELPSLSDELSAEVIEEVNTKLELARAYEEMGDAEGAKELLDEVMREGSAEQREAAARLLERLG